MQCPNFTRPAQDRLRPCLRLMTWREFPSRSLVSPWRLVMFSTSLLLLNRKLSVSVFRLSFALTKSLRMSTSSRVFVLAMESRPTSGSLWISSTSRMLIVSQSIPLGTILVTLRAVLKSSLLWVKSRFSIPRRFVFLCSRVDVLTGFLLLIRTLVSRWLTRLVLLSRTLKLVRRMRTSSLLPSKSWRPNCITVYGNLRGGTITSKAGTFKPDNWDLFPEIKGFWTLDVKSNLILELTEYKSTTKW